MSDPDALERRLEAWLEETAQPMPPELLGEIVVTAPLAHRLGIRARFPSGGRWRFALVGFAAVAVVAVALGAALRIPPGPAAGTSPTAPSIASSPVPSPSPSPVSSPPPSPTAPQSPPDAPRLGEWHRNNYNAGEEQLFCLEAIDGWTCTYDVPDGRGSFSGEAVTSSWACPTWFPTTICDSVVAVYRGSAWYGPLEGQPGPTSELISQEYVITEAGGQPVLQLYWVGQHVCPWYRTFQAALAADYECVLAP